MTVNALSEPVKLTATMSPLQKNRTLNDHFRKTARGGIVSISWGIHMLGRAEVDTIMKNSVGRRAIKAMMRAVSTTMVRSPSTVGASTGKSTTTTRISTTCRQTPRILTKRRGL